MRFHWPISLRESKPIVNAESKIISGQYGIGDLPEVTFAKLIEYHDCTPQIQIGVTAYSELITGTEMQINTDNEKAKKIIEDWNIENNFYDKFENMVSTLLICGNSILEKLDEKNTLDVVEVDMKTITNKKRDKFGNTLYYEQQQENYGKARLGEGKLEKFIEFNLSNYSQQAWGKSLFYALAKTRTVGNRTLLPLVEILWAMEDAMSAIFVNTAYPIKTITYEGSNSAELEKEANKWKLYKPGDTVIQARKPIIEFFESQNTTGKYTDYVAHIEKTVELGIKFPHDIMTGDFTSRASSETTENIVLKLARGFQRYLSNKLVQELYNPILEQNGISPKETNLQISFSTQNIIHLKPETINFLVGSGVITKAEAREWMKGNTGMDLFDDSKIEDKETENPLIKKGMVHNKKKDDEDKKSLKDQIESLKERIIIRETADRAGKIKLTKEI